MYLNDPQHLQVQDINASQVADLAMAFIHDKLIEPMMENDMLDKDDVALLNVVGGALKTLAVKAKAYEHLYENKHDANFLRN